MMQEKTVSVCMSTYNGANFIAEQIESILMQLNHKDELIIVDDCSTDGTIDYLLSLKNERIKLFINGNNVGHVKSFSNCINLATNEYVILSDQDDIWIEGRLSAFKKSLNSDAYLVSSNFILINQNKKIIENLDLPYKSPSEYHCLRNIFHIFVGCSSYHGCTMGLSRKLFKIILPVPGYVESHDLWIAMGANLMGNIRHIDDNTLLRRIHGKNVSFIKRSFIKNIFSRIIFIISLIHLLSRILKVNINRLS